MSSMLLNDITDKSILTLLELVSDGVWDWSANRGMSIEAQVGTQCWVMTLTLLKIQFLLGKV